MAKTIVITVATSGIGYTIALACARQGANVAISGRRADGRRRTVAEFGRKGKEFRESDRGGRLPAAQDRGRDRPGD